MKLKKSMALLLSLVMIFTTIPFAVFNASAGYDTTAPIIKSVTMNEKSIIKPSVISLTLDVIEEETGVASISVTFGTSDKSLYGSQVAYQVFNPSIGGGTSGYSNYPGVNVRNVFSGEVTLEYLVSSKYSANDLQISYMSITDNQGNERKYSGGWDDSLNERVYPFAYDNNIAYLTDCYNGYDKGNSKCYVYNDTVEVKNEFDVNFQSYVTNPDNVNKLQAMPETETAMINYDSKSHIVAKGLFDAIKGTKKTIVFSNDGVQWVARGSDITNDTKDIDLNVVATTVSGSEFGTSDRIVSLKFPDNGQLPGKMTVRLRTGYTATGNLKLYYYNNDEVTLENETATGFVDGSELWNEVTVTHNSTFLLSKSQLKSPTKVSKNPTIKLSARKKIIKKKKSFILKVSNLAKGDYVKTVRLSKKAVATVKRVKKNRYKITGKKKGKATITVTLKSGKKATCKIKVK